MKKLSVLVLLALLGACASKGDSNGGSRDNPPGPGGGSGGGSGPGGGSKPNPPPKYDFWSTTEGSVEAIGKATGISDFNFKPSDFNQLGYASKQDKEFEITFEYDQVLYSVLGNAKLQNTTGIMRGNMTTKPGTQQVPEEKLLTYSDFGYWTRTSVFNGGRMDLENFKIANAGTFVIGDENMIKPLSLKEAMTFSGRALGVAVARESGKDDFQSLKGTAKMTVDPTNSFYLANMTVDFEDYYSFDFRSNSTGTAWAFDKISDTNLAASTDSKYKLNLALLGAMGPVKMQFYGAESVIEAVGQFMYKGQNMLGNGLEINGAFGMKKNPPPAKP